MLEHYAREQFGPLGPGMDVNHSSIRKEDKTNFVAHVMRLQDKKSKQRGVVELNGQTPGAFVSSGATGNPRSVWNVGPGLLSRRC